MLEPHSSCNTKYLTRWRTSRTSDLVGMDTPPLPDEGKKPAPITTTAVPLSPDKSRAIRSYALCLCPKDHLSNSRCLRSSLKVIIESRKRNMQSVCRWYVVRVPVCDERVRRQRWKSWATGANDPAWYGSSNEGECLSQVSVCRVLWVVPEMSRHFAVLHFSLV